MLNKQTDKILKEWIGESLEPILDEDIKKLVKVCEQIAEQAIESCIPEELKKEDIYTHSSISRAEFNGYNNCIQDMRKNRDNYLKG